MRKCKIDGCDKKHLANGLCSVHYQRVWKGGPIGSVKSRGEITASERIKDKVEISATGCWVYTGKLTKKGYAHVRSDGGKMRFAHGIMYEEKYGAVPSGLELDHTCRNRACCNPDHLEAVTHGENVRRGISGHNWKDLHRCDKSGRFLPTPEEKGII